MGLDPGTVYKQNSRIKEGQAITGLVQRIEAGTRDRKYPFSYYARGTLREKW